MKPRILFVLLACATVTVAFQPPDRQPLPNLDRRTVSPAKNKARQASGVVTLQKRLPNAKVDFDPLLGTPKSVRQSGGFLTGPGGVGGGVSEAGAAKVGATSHRAVKAFVADNSDLFDYDAAALRDEDVTREFITAHNGMKTVVWQQKVDGVPVFEATMIAHTTRRDELVTVSSQFVPAANEAANAGASKKSAKRNEPVLSAASAIAIAASNIAAQVVSVDLVSVGAPAGAEQKQFFMHPAMSGETEARLVWLPLNVELLRLCWQITLTSQQRGEMFRIVVDAENGEVLVRHGLTEYISDASYRVYTSDSPSPFSPGHSTPLGTQPAVIARTLVTLPALDTNASPLGWIDDGMNDTRGNNVDAHLDRISDNVPDGRPVGSPFRVFDFPLDLTQSPSTYTNAAVVQLFYMCNWIHDRLYQLGFTEAAGNFQINNFGRGGLGNDPVQADAQDGGGFNNANFSTPQDGSSGRMQMYLWSYPSPQRDGDFDSEIVIHEYVHGLSNRRVGGGAGLSALQSRGMGEGWSDWYALSLLSEAGDSPAGAFAKGGYSTYQYAGQTANYYFGIRRYPYSTDMTRNPLTFKDIDPTRASPHTGIPRSITAGTSADAVHNQGEVWCVTLWEARANLVAKHGFATGNELMLKLVTDGMNLAPPNPTFLQARDAILQASLVHDGGTDLPDLWAGFAKRGMGYSATGPASSTTMGVLEAFDVPDSLNVFPGTGFTANGPVGGPFLNAARVFTLRNTGTNTITWSATSTVPWLSLSQTTGTLTVGDSNVVVVSVNAAANSLAAGIYNGAVRFTNQTSGIGQERTFTARIGQPEYFTESFDSLDHDLDNQTLTFTPDGSTNFYSVCREPTMTFPTDPTGGTLLSLSGHTTLTLTTPTNVSIYGRSNNVIYLASEGHVTMLSPDSSGSTALANHFALPRVSASMVHFHPNENGGVVSWRHLSNRVAITFERVVEYGTFNTNNFQFELFYDGRIRMTHLAIGSTYGLVGLSAGSGLPAGFIESDLSGYGPCLLPLTISMPTNVVEGDGVLAGQVNILAPLASDLSIALSSTAPGQISVPTNVVILAGQTSATFALTVIDDAALDGPQTVTVSASTPGYFVALGSILVGDNETAALTLLVPSEAIEGSSPTPALLWASAVPSADIRVALHSSDTSELQVPASVIIPAGQTSVVFNVILPEDALIDGDQTATVTAQVPNWTAAVSITVVHDNEPTNLVVVLPPSLREGVGWSAFGTLRIAGALPTNLVVSLASSDMTEVQILTPSITIPAGNTSNSFLLFVQDDPDIDSSQLVVVTASAPGFVTGSNTIVITDNESPFEPFNPSPAHLATNVAQTSDLFWSSGALPGETITNDVYFGTSPALGAGQKLGTTTATFWSLPVLAPQTTYYWQVIAHNGGHTPSPVWQFTTRGVDHFVWGSLAGTQFVNQPFNATITGRDVYGTPVTNFTGPAQLSVQPPSQNISFSPTNTGVFVNGVWTGSITVHEPSLNVALRADDGAGHFGLSTPLAVRLQNDLAVTVYDTPDPVSLGGQLTYSITVTNIGPLAATAVVLSNQLPAGVAILSAVPSQGSVTTNGNALVFDLGVLPADSFATMSVVAAANTLGTLSNHVSVSRAETDAYLPNNSAAAFTTVRSPTVVISDVSLFEGNSGSRTAIFHVIVSPPPALPVSVNYTTMAGSASAPNDFIATNGVVSFAVNQSTQTISVTVVSELFHETDETFYVNLVGVTNATIADSQGEGTIRNDDSQPTLSISDVILQEGNVGATNAVFNVALSVASGQSVSFSFFTSSGNATAGSDYVATNGFATITPGATNISISVRVMGDLTVEPDEVFYVTLNGVANAIPLKREAYGLILNDDGLPGYVSRFVWSPIAPEQYLGAPFNAMVTAYDAFDEPATTFAGTAQVTATVNAPGTSHTILSNVVALGSGSGTYTLAYAFTPSQPLTVTHVRSYSGNKVSIWTDGGVLLAAQAVNGPNGTWTDTPLPNVVQLSAGVTYRVGFYTTGSWYYHTNPPTFAHGTLVNGYYLSTSDTFPTEFYINQNLYLCDLRYSVAGSGSIETMPSNIGPFVNGVWTGELSLLQPGTNVTLHANDGNGHFGSSNPFDVALQNDVALLMSDTPDPAAIGAEVTYRLTVTNAGPLSATAVVVTNYLPAGVTVNEVIASRGSCTVAGGIITWELGSFTANDSATVAITVVANSMGLLTNRAAVYRAEVDSWAGDNAATNVTAVLVPALSINNVSVFEGNSGSTSMLFTVSLSVAPATNVTVDFTSLNGTAQSPADYLPVSGTLVFAPGETNQFITVFVNGETNHEPHEVFSIVLANAVNATLADSNSIGIGTILNDDQGPFFDDFEPNIDLTQWSSFGGVVGTTILATNYGGSVSAPNSLWFGAETIRFIVSRPLNCLLGGTINFHLRLANGSSPWETVDVPGEGVVIEYSTNGTTWTLIATFDTTNYYNWTSLSVVIPPAAQSPATLFRWRQISHSGSCCDHWALDNVSALLGPQPPFITTHPTSRTAVSGGTVTFTVVAGGSAPLGYQWRKNGTNIAGATNPDLVLTAVQTNDAGAYTVLVTNAYGSALSAAATLTVIEAPPAADFRILSLTANNSAVIDHNALTGDDRGGIAISQSQVLYSGDNSTARFAVANLSGGVALGQIFDALVSDLRTGTMYSLASATGPLPSSGSTITRLLEHDSVTGLLNGQSIPLSTTITAISSGNSVGLFAGYGYVMIHNGSRVYHIALPSGAVTDLGAMAVPAHTSTESWAYWGVSEKFGGNYYITYVQNSQTITRMAVPSGVTNTVGTFSNLGDMACFTVSPTLGRWYFHYEGSAQFGGTSETLGYADATFLINGSTNGPANTNPPAILVQPAPITVTAGSNAIFSVVATGSMPLRYQWRSAGLNIPGATNSAYTVVNVQTNHAGLYSVVVTNNSGSVTSSAALLTVLPSPFVVLAQSNVTVTIANTAARIASLRFRSNELFRVGTFVSDWGLQISSNSSTFMRNPNAEGAVNQIPMTLLNAGERNASFAGTYTTAFGSVAVTRDFSLAQRSDVLRTATTFRNNGTGSIMVRYFETFDVDLNQGGSNVFSTANDRYLIANTPAIYTGRSALTNQGMVMAMGTTEPGALVSASSSSYFAITSSGELNTFFNTGGGDSQGLLADAAIDIGKEFILIPGGSAGFVFYQSLGTNLAAADLGLIQNAGTNAPLRLYPPAQLGGVLRLEVGTMDNSPLSPYRAAGIQFDAVDALTFPVTNWTTMTNTAVLTNGILRMNNLTITNAPARFFRVRELGD